MEYRDEMQLPLFQIDSETIADAEASKGDIPDKESVFSKYIVYVDESGDHSLQSIDENYPIFVLAFCIFHKRHYSEVAVPALEKFKFNYFGHDQVVLHENEVRKEEGRFNIFRSREQKNQFLNELNHIIDHSNFILVSCTIDKRLLRKPGDVDTNAYHIALGFCL